MLERDTQRDLTGRDADVASPNGVLATCYRSHASRVPFLGRRRERAAVGQFLSTVRSGESAALVVRGEAGSGKTALIAHALDAMPGLQVARVGGAESEMELPFAALHLLCAPMLDRLDRLPAPQGDALRTAFGLSAGGRPDRFMVGLAVLSLLSETAEDQPLVCLIDDAQWLDQASAQTLAFVARRLHARSVGVMFAVRGEVAELADLPEVALEGLSPAESRELLAAVFCESLDESVRERIIAEAQGNPLALLELSDGLTMIDLAGGFGLPPALPLAGWAETSLQRRVDSLSDETRMLLLIVASDPTGEPLLLWRAAEALGVGPASEAAVEASPFLRLGARVVFRDPLVRSAIYGSVSAEDRRCAHRALADTTDSAADPDRRAWHRSRAAVAPDEDVAAELERSVGRAQERGGLAAAAAFLEQAAALTPDRSRRAERSLAAARAKHDAGAYESALELVVTTETGGLGELESAQLDRLRADVRFALGRGGGDSSMDLLDAARRLEPLDAEAARDTYLEAFRALMLAGGRAPGDAGVRLAEAALAMQRPDAPRAADLLLEGLATRIADGYLAAQPILRQALAAFPAEELGTRQDARSLFLASRCAVDMWDDEAFDELVRRQILLVRGIGCFAGLPAALHAVASSHLLAGDLDGAAAVADEARAAQPVSGQFKTEMMIAAWRGREAPARAAIEDSVTEATARGEGLMTSHAELATAILANGLGRYEEALAAARRVCERDEPGLAARALPELIEAAVRSGKPELAAEALPVLLERASLSGTDWALGMTALARALLSDGRRAEALYREAIDRLMRTRVAGYRARAHLLYGEWLRRDGRRVEAREQLRIAQEMLASMGSEAFCARAERELRATGEHARKRTPDAAGQLTPQEAQIAALARDGHTNSEIGTQLFISPRTVEYHLHKVFSKLDIKKRAQLLDCLPHSEGVLTHSRELARSLVYNAA